MRVLIVIANILPSMACFLLAAVFIHADDRRVPYNISYLVMLCLVFAVLMLGSFTFRSRRGDTGSSA